MKHLIFAASLAATLIASAEIKFATVEMLTLVKNHPNYESNKALLTTTEKDYQKKIDALKAELETVQAEGKKLAEQARNPMLSASAKQKLEKDLIEIQNKFLSGQQRMRSEAMRSQQDLQDLEARLLKTTSEDIRKRVKKFAEANGYDLIADSSAAVYARPAYDVTPEILRAMGVDPATVKKDQDTDKGKAKNESK